MSYRTVVPIGGMSNNFDDYPSDSRERLEGAFTLVEIYVPNEFAAHLRIGAALVVEVDEVHP